VRISDARIEAVKARRDLMLTRKEAMAAMLDLIELRAAARAFVAATRSGLPRDAIEQRRALARLLQGSDPANRI